MTATGAFRAGRGAVVVATVVVVLLLLPMVLPEPDRADFGALLTGPSVAHPLGTDQLGRDMLARLLTGARLTVGLTVVTVALTGVVGVAVGMVAAVSGAVGRAVMRVVDALASVPVVLVGLLAAVALGPGVGSLVLAIGLIGWTPFARQAYLLTVAESGREYVAAADGLGAGLVRVLTRHVARNVAPPLLAHTCVRFAGTLLTVSGLSFLGLGVQPPTAEWGTMVAESREYLFTAPHVVLVPSIAVVLTAGTVLWWGRRWDRVGCR